MVHVETVESTAAYLELWTGVRVGGVGGLEVLVGLRKGSRIMASWPSTGGVSRAIMYVVNLDNKDQKYPSRVTPHFPHEAEPSRGYAVRFGWRTCDKASPIELTRSTRQNSRRVNPKTALPLTPNPSTKHFYSAHQLKWQLMLKNLMIFSLREIQNCVQTS